MPTTATPSRSELIRVADAAFPGGSLIAQLILLSGNLLTASATADATTDKIIFATAHGLVTGSRLRITGSPTAPLLVATTYYAIGLNALEIKLAATLSDAQTGTAINLTASGTINIEEQLSSSLDPIDVLLNKELPASSYYARTPITITGAAVAVMSEAEKPPVTIPLTNSTAAAISHRHYLVAMGATGAIGSTIGITGFYMITEPSLQSTPAGVAREFTLTFGAKP